MSIRKLFLTITLLLGLGVVLLPSAQAAAFDPFGDVCKNAPTGADAPAICSQKPTTDNPLSGSSGLIIKAARIIALIGGITAVIVIIVAAIKFQTSGGDPTRVNSAKNTIIYASVGLIVAAVSTGILSFILSKL